MFIADGNSISITPMKFYRVGDLIINLDHLVLLEHKTRNRELVYIAYFAHSTNDMAFSRSWAQGSRSDPKGYKDAHALFKALHPTKD